MQYRAVQGDVCRPVIAPSSSSAAAAVRHGGAGCDGDGDADTMRIFDNQLGDIIISSTSSYSISFNFNTSDGVLYSVFDDYGYGDAFSGPACKAVDIGGLDVTITQQ